MKDPYVYSSSEILINLADIHDEQELKQMEADYTAYRLSELTTNNFIKQYNFDSLCATHHYIFQDVFEWAGKPRIINIEKAEVVLGELSIEYSDYASIVCDANQILEEMNR